VAWLMREKELVDTVIDIRTALKTKDPDTDVCVTLMQRLLRSDLEPLVIIKQPSLSQTIRLLRGYQGPTAANLRHVEPEERERLKRNARNISNMAETLYKKIVALFKFKESGATSFQEFLQEKIKRFDAATASMSPAQKLALTEFPPGLA